MSIRYNFVSHGFSSIIVIRFADAYDLPAPESISARHITPFTLATTTGKIPASSPGPTVAWALRGIDCRSWREARGRPWQKISVANLGILSQDLGIFLGHWDFHGIFILRIRPWDFSEFRK